MDIHLIRRQNLLKLYAEFVAQSQREDPSISASGLDRAFALKLQTANTSLSSMKKGSRQIGSKLAQQFAVACQRPVNWLDEDHSEEGEPATDEESDLQRFVKLATRAYKRCDTQGRQDLVQTLRKCLHVS